MELTTLPIGTDDWLRCCGWEVIMNEPQSPVIVPKDFRFFGPLKKDVTEKCFAKDLPSCHFSAYAGLMGTICYPCSMYSFEFEEVLRIKYFGTLFLNITCARVRPRHLL